MIQNINFPEGTILRNEHLMGGDYFAEDYVFPPETIFDFEVITNSNNSRPVCCKPLCTTNITTLNSMYDGAKEQTWVPTLNTSNSNTVNIGGNKVKLVLSGGTYPNASFTYSNNPPPTIWVEYGYDWTNVFKNLPPNTNAVPYGDIPVRVRILKDGAWLDGQPVQYNHLPMEYLGGGLYGSTVHVRPRDIKYNFPLEVGDDKQSVMVRDGENICYFGDNSGIVDILQGTDILNYATSNEGWYYDSELGGVRNNTINHNGVTRLTLVLPSKSITVDYGQISEKNYDFCEVYDENGGILYTFKGVSTDNATAVIESPSNTYVFRYKKDGSSTTVPDIFWIKKITYTLLPDYPTN